MWGTANFDGGCIYLPDGGNLRTSVFDHLNLFQSWKQLSMNTEHQFKKNSLTCVYKGWSSNKNGTGTMATTKNKVFVGL